MSKKIVKKVNRFSTFEGLPVVDASKDVDIVINKRDVTESKKKDPNNCAAAMAGKRELKTDVRVYITRTYVKDNVKNRWVRFITPMAIQKEIVSFDRGASFEPGNYQFKAPVESNRLGYKSHGPSYKGTGTRKKNKHHITANVRISAKDKMIPAHPERHNKRK